jgi:hypothetical protein
MGTWGNRNFENDAAADFLAEFRHMPTDAILLDALMVVVEAGEEEMYIEADEASTALAAAEVVAASLGKPSPDFPEALTSVVQDLGSGENNDIRKLAKKAVKQVLRASELQELWAEQGQPNDWEAVQRDLLVRLKKPR